LQDKVISLRKYFPARQKRFIFGVGASSSGNEEYRYFNDLARHRFFMLAGMGNALGMVIMSIATVNLRHHAEKQEAAKESPRSNALKPGNSDMDAAFEAFMNQLLGALLQTGQQAIDTAKETAPSAPTTANQSSPIAILADRDAAQQPTDDSAPSALGLQAAAETSDSGKAVTAFSEAIKAVAGQEEQPKPVVKTISREKNIEQNRDNLQGTAAGDAQSELYGEVKTDYKISSKHPENDADTSEAMGDDAIPYRNSTEPVPVKTDFANLLQQDHSASRLQDGHVVSQGAANASGSHGPLPQRVAEPDELFDHAVSIVRDGNRLAVKLEPEGLGKLDINISLEKGMVNAQIQVSDEATRTLIENNMQQMVHALLSEGLSVGGFSVAMDNRMTGDNAADAHESSNQVGETALPVVAPASRSAAPGLVSIFV
jgi:flagellar hook-length control protein FliK